MLNPVFAAALPRSAPGQRAPTGADAAVVAAIEQLGTRMAAMQEVLLRKLDKVDARVRALEAKRSAGDAKR